MTSDGNRLEPTQADREAAANHYELMQGRGRGDFALKAREGKRDRWVYVQAFARHRIASTEQLQAEIERLREALKELAQPVIAPPRTTDEAFEQRQAMRDIARSALTGSSTDE